MSEVLKKIALPLVVLGFYPLVKLLSETTINMPTSGQDIDVSLKVLEFLWAIILAVAMQHFYRKVMKSETPIPTPVAQASPEAPGFGIVFGIIGVLALWWKLKK